MRGSCYGRLIKKNHLNWGKKEGFQGEIDEFKKYQKKGKGWTCDVQF